VKATDLADARNQNGYGARAAESLGSPVDPIRLMPRDGESLTGLVWFSPAAIPARAGAAHKSQWSGRLPFG
jgi:hypothetical protein